MIKPHQEHAIREIIQEVCELDKLPDLNDALEDLNADSLDVVEIALKIESELNVELNDAELAQTETIQDIINVIAGKLKDSF